MTLSKLWPQPTGEETGRNTVVPESDDGGKDIHSAPARDIIWRTGRTALFVRQEKSGLIQGGPTVGNVMTQLRPGKPQQCNRARDMRRRHRRSAKTCIIGVGAVVARANVRSRRANIRFYSIAPIYDHWATAAKGSDVIRARSQRADRIGRRVDRWRIFHSRTIRTCAIRSHHHHDAGSGLRFDSRLQRINRTTFGRWAAPCVNCDIGSPKRIALTAAYRIRGKKPFHAFEVSGWRAITLIHVTTTDPFRCGRHANLVTHAVIANCRANRMRAMANVVARKRRIIAAWISNAVVDGVMPVVIVIGRDSIPAAVLRLQRVVCPTLTSIRAANGNSLASEPQRPDIRRVRVGDVRFDRLGLLRSRRAASKSSRLRQRILNVRIAFDSRHVLPASQCFGYFATAFHQNRVHNVKGAMLDPAFTQPLQDRPLRCLALVP